MHDPQPADMLCSIATTQWKSMDAREEIDKLVKEINRTGDKYWDGTNEIDRVDKRNRHFCDFLDLAHKYHFSDIQSFCYAALWSVFAAVLQGFRWCIGREALRDAGVFPVAYVDACQHSGGERGK